VRPQLGIDALGHVDRVPLRAVPIERDRQREDPARANGTRTALYGLARDEIQRSPLVVGAPASPVRDAGRQLLEFGRERHGRTLPAPRGYGQDVPVAERIDCMECGGIAYLAQPIGPEDVLEPGDVLVYLCGECAQRWDVVVDEADITDD
jgi:hypothetical protein